MFLRSNSARWRFEKTPESFCWLFRRRASHLLLQDDVLSLPVFHHAKCLQCADDVIRIDRHFLQREEKKIMFEYTININFIHELPWTGRNVLAKFGWSRNYASSGDGLMDTRR
jgi:hypothetical protein